MSMNSSSSSSSSAHEKIKYELIHSLCEDLPLLQYGSGDFPLFSNPSRIEPTTLVVAQLTVQYIERLVRAAVDAQDILLDGVGGILPRVMMPMNNPQEENHSSPATVSYKSPRKKQQHQQKQGKEDDIMNWENPLPTKPTIINHSLRSPREEQQQQQQQQTMTSGMIQGVDFFSSLQSSKDLFCYPSTNYIPINTECFLFPISHDAILYSRIQELLNIRSTMVPTHRKMTMMENKKDDDNNNNHHHHNPILIDPVVWSMMQMESSDMMEQTLLFADKQQHHNDHDHLDDDETKKKIPSHTSKRQRLHNNIQEQLQETLLQSSLSPTWPFLDRQTNHFVLPTYMSRKKNKNV